MPSWTDSDLQAYLDRIRQRDKARTALSHTESKRDETEPLGQAIPRETKSLSRTRVRFTGYRIRPLDPDNFAGGTKDLLDGLRHAGLLHGDDPTQIILETEQIRVSHRTDQKTVVEITYP